MLLLKEGKGKDFPVHAMKPYGKAEIQFD
jgi:hypothetical protein